MRSLGRWTLAGLVLNTVIGTGIFVLPGTAAARLGWASMWAWAIAALLTGAMVLCFAEVASRFDAGGGAYLYAQKAFGRYAGVQIGWVNYFARITAAAAQANAFTAYLGALWLWADTRVGAVTTSTVFIGLLAAANVRSVRSGARVSNIFALIKMLPLLAFGALGIAWLVAGQGVAPPIAADTSVGGWLQLLLLLMFAFGGFESALIPLAEAKDPRRDAPVALFTGLALVTVLYLVTQLAVLATLDNPGATDRPIAESARVMFGNAGAAAVAVAAIVSIYGWLASMILTVPRITQAMADRGDLPRIFGEVHPRFRTPYISIIVFAGLAWFLSVQGSLIQNLSLSAVSRLVVSGTVCASLPVFRRRDRTAPAGSGAAAMFRSPFGMVMSVVGVLTSVLLASRMNAREGYSIIALFVVGTVHWLVVRRAPPPSH